MFAFSGLDMPCVHDVVPLLDVAGVIEALIARLHGTGSGGLYCPHAGPHSGCCFLHIRAVI